MFCKQDAPQRDVEDQFIAEKCCLTPGVSVSLKELRDAYERWCEQRKFYPLLAEAFGDKLESLGAKLVCAGVYGAGAMRWAGILVCWRKPRTKRLAGTVE